MMTDGAPALAEIVGRIVARLEGAEARDEALATVKEPRGVAVFKTALSFVPAGRAWRLGVLLLERTGTLHLTGAATRAVEPKDFIANKSGEAEERRAMQHAAARSRFAPGEVVNYGYSTIAVDDATLATGRGVIWLDGDIPMLRLEGTSSVALERYLTERVDLLLGLA